MGPSFAKPFQFISSWSKTKVKILMVGIDGAGQTTVVQRLKGDAFTATIPSLGLTCEFFETAHCRYEAWDIAARGEGTLWPLVRHYVDRTDGVVLVVDSSDRARVEESRGRLAWLLGIKDGGGGGWDELRHAPVLVLANKQDCSGAMGVEDVAEVLCLESLLSGPEPRRSWHIQGTCAVSGEGLQEGLSWLHSTIVVARKKRWA